LDTVFRNLFQDTVGKANDVTGVRRPMFNSNHQGISIRMEMPPLEFFI